MESMLQPPPPFCFEKDLANITSGNLSIQWSKWKKSFLIYHSACQLDLKEESVQVNILLHIIGEQCRDVYEQFLPDNDVKIEGLLKKFDTFFTPKKNITIVRHRFFIRNQQEHETVEQYSFELNKLASSCEFKDLKDDLVRDRLICGLREEPLRERLLREYDLTLTKALDICNVAEVSRMQAGTMKTEQNTKMAMHWMQRQQHHGASGSYQGCARASNRQQGSASSESCHSPHTQHERTWSGSVASAGPAAPAHQQQRALSITSTRGTQRQAGRDLCGYCGSIHEKIKFKCPAFGQKCAKCNRMGHFARVCRVYSVRENSVDHVHGDSYTDASGDCCIDRCTVK